MATKKIICDTDVMIDYWDITNSRHSSTKEILENLIGLNNVVLSAITKMELMLGAVNKKDMILISKKLKRFNIALINKEITSIAFDLLQSFYLSHGLKIPDCLIASTAIITELELFTYNTKDFNFINQLKLYSF